MLKSGLGRLWAAVMAMLLTTLLTGAPAPAAASPKTAISAKPAGGLKAFSSDMELKIFLRRLKVASDEDMRRNPPPPPPPPPPSPPPPPVGASAPATVAVTGVTNNQEANVDEGDIVKVRGDILVVLRRGRLFTVSTAGGGLRPVDSANAYPPGVDGHGDWYDEMLISGDRVVVIGYSYARGGTQINRFRLSDDGRLKFEDAYQIRSADYYSSRNYASRLIGDKLIVYAPLDLNFEKDPLEALPAVRKWSGQKGREGFRRIAGARQIYMGPMPRRNWFRAVGVLHSITSCDLSKAEMACTASGVLGPWARTFYVSGKAVYLWTSLWDEATESVQATLYRLPLDGGRPSALKVHGQPVDQFAFREDAADHVLNVLVRSQGAGDGMWSPEFATGSVALLQLPISELGSGRLQAARARYRILPKPTKDSYAFQNRYVGDYVLYGTGATWGAPTGQGGEVTVAPLHGGEAAQLALSHSVDRIEQMGGDAVVIGGRGADLVFTPVEFGAGAPRLGEAYLLKAASQGETRSHGFFFQPSAGGPDGSGVLGLPVTLPGRPGYRQLVEGSAAVIFLRRLERRFQPLGTLDASDKGLGDDGCVASCVDWYGNARPIFLGRRVFALMGYELVEGEVTAQGVREVGRASFAVDRQGRPAS